MTKEDRMELEEYYNRMKDGLSICPTHQLELMADWAMTVDDADQDKHYRDALIRRICYGIPGFKRYLDSPSIP